METLFWIGFVGALVAGLFAWMQAKRVLSYSEGTEKMRKIAASIRAGANAYLKQQYTAVFKVFLVVFILLLVIAFGEHGIKRGNRSAAANAISGTLDQCR